MAGAAVISMLSETPETSSFTSTRRTVFESIRTDFWTCVPKPVDSTDTS
jgi:hypothetical protein